MKQSIATAGYYTTNPSLVGIETNVTIKFSDGVEKTVSAEEAKQLMRELNKSKKKKNRSFDNGIRLLYNSVSR